MKLIKISPDVGGFAENKDDAQIIRTQQILPALDRNEKVVLDFEGIHFATQSFMHTLIGEPIQKYHEDVLDLIEFKNCSPQLRSLIQLVVDYSLGGFPVEKVG